MVLGVWVGGVDDVLKARLKTIGVSEYKFEMEAGPQTGTEWRIVDVGGSRFQVRLLFPAPSFIPSSTDNKLWDYSDVSAVHVQGCARLRCVNKIIATWVPFFDDGVPLLPSSLTPIFRPPAS